MTKSVIAGEHSFDVFASLATGTINVFATAVAREHSFDAFASLVTGAFKVFATSVGVPIDCPGLFCHCCGKSSDCRGIAYGRPGKCIVRGIISSKRAKDFCALWVGSSAHRAVNAPLIDGGACTTFLVGNREGGGHDMGGGLCGLVVRVWL
jgi:hypothetical protein